MIIPMIHRWLRRNDLALLVAEIAEADADAAQRAITALDAGNVDAVLDSPTALAVVRGRGGAPAALSLPLLWYIPVRATLRERGVPDIDIADFTATLPVTFASSRALRRLGVGEPALTRWIEVISALPAGTVVKAERAAHCAAVALWWAGCFPERISALGGHGTLRAYADFAARALEQAAAILQRHDPEQSLLYSRLARRAPILLEGLRDARTDYLGRSSHSPSARLARYLTRMRPDEPTADTDAA